MRPKQIDRVIVECAKDKLCSSVIAAAATSLGVDPRLVSSALTVVAASARKPGSEEFLTTLTFPSGYAYCKTTIAFTSIVPYSGPRGSLFKLFAQDDQVRLCMDPKSGFYRRTFMG
jgi:hypothetical protein